MIKKAIGAALLAWVARSLVTGLQRRTARRRATAAAEEARVGASTRAANPAL